jgi:hypothetical protein
VSQGDSVQSVARELSSPSYGEWITTFKEQALDSAAFAHAINFESKSTESITGDETIARANGAIAEARSGATLDRGDAIQTGGDGVAGVSLLDGTSFDLATSSKAPLDGPGPGTKRIQLALSDVRVDDEPIRPFGVYDLLEGSRVIDTIDSPDSVVEVRRTPTGQISVTRSSADPAAQAQHYNDALRVQNLGAEYGINPNGRGSGTSPGPFLQPINFTIDLPGVLGPPAVDPIGARVSPILPGVPDTPVILIPEPPPVVRAALTPVLLAGPSFADTVTFDEFTAVTGTVSANNPNPSTTLTFGIVGGTDSGTSSASTSGPVALSALSTVIPVGEGYDVSARGSYGTLYLNSATGAYIFVPDDAAINALTEDTTETFVFTVSDGTTTVSQPFTIALNGENDEPLLSPVTGFAFADTAASDDFDAVTGTLQATDVDANAVQTYGIAGGASDGPVVVNGASYDVSQRGSYGTLYVNSATGAYVFVPDDKAINGLTADTTETFTFTVSDGTLTDSQPFTVALHGENDKPELKAVTGPTYTDTKACDDFARATGTLQATDVDTDAALTYGIAGGKSCGPVVLKGVSYDVSQRGDYGTLYVNSATGDYVFVPDDKAINGLTADTTETFTFTVSDGTLTDSQPFEVTLDGKNDKPVLSPVTGPTYTDTQACDDFAPAAGTLQASDADAGTTLSYGIAGGTGCHPIVLNCISYDVSQRGDYGTLYVNSATGDYVFVPDDRAINGLTCDATETFTFTVSDGALTDSQCFEVTLDGKNDKPVLSPVCGPTYTDTPACDDFAPAAGTLQASDADAGTTLSYGIAGGTDCHPVVLNCISYDVSKRGDYGTLYVNSESGAYVFVPDDRAINGLCHDATESFTLTVSDGALCDSQPFTVTLNDDNHYFYSANNLTALNDAMPEAGMSTSVAQAAPAQPVATTDSGAPAGEVTGNETVTLTQTVSVEHSWVETFVSHDDAGDHFDLADDAGGADPAHASSAAIVVSVEGPHSFIFQSSPAWGIQLHASNPVDSQIQSAASLDSEQPSVDDANNNSEIPANQALDIALSALQLQLRGEPDHFILQA